jgi:hypothetical protein
MNPMNTNNFIIFFDLKSLLTIKNVVKLKIASKDF